MDLGYKLAVKKPNAMHFVQGVTFCGSAKFEDVWLQVFGNSSAIVLHLNVNVIVIGNGRYRHNPLAICRNSREGINHQVFQQQFDPQAIGLDFG